jgi:hypothetical protein
MRHVFIDYIALRTHSANLHKAQFMRELCASLGVYL